MPQTASETLPKNMKAEVIDRFGPPDTMHPAMVPVPTVGDHEVLIRVASAGVGAWDPYLCTGEFDTGSAFPRVLGSDGAGTVVATGARVQRFRPGDSVYAWGFANPRGGFYAEYAAVPEDEVSLVPETLSPQQAGALAVDGLTALAGLDLLALGPGRTLAISGASGGVGHLALQLAKRQGARVFAVASGKDGVALASRLGADESVEGHTRHITARLRAFAPDGLDAALLLTGARADEVLAVARRHARAAYPNGVELAPRSRRGIRVQAFDGYHGRDALERLTALVAAGPFRVEVSRTYDLHDVPRALVDVGKHHLGKLAVVVH